MEKTVEKVNSLGMTKKQMETVYHSREPKARLAKTPHLHWFKNSSLCEICGKSRDEVGGAK